MLLLRRALLGWLPIAVAVTCLGVLGYGAVQQVYRTGADDPQVQLAHEAAAALAAGQSPETVVAAVRARSLDGRDIALGRSGDEDGSLAPFLIVYNAAGAPVASSARLASEMPRIPSGVLTAAEGSGENRVTWQPASSLRIAAVAVPDRPSDKARYVAVAGRSLREAESRIASLTQMAVAGWVFTLIAAFLAVLVTEILKGRA